MKYLVSALCFPALLLTSPITFGQTPTPSSPSPGSKARGSASTTPSGAASPAGSLSQKDFEEEVQGIKARIGAAAETVMVRIEKQEKDVRNQFASSDKPERLA